MGLTDISGLAENEENFLPDPPLQGGSLALLGGRL